MDKQKIVINIGGSILSPSEDALFDFAVARNIKATLDKLEDYQFILCIGGGQLVRKYQALLGDQGFEDTPKHRIGIAGININAEMLKSVFGDSAEDEVLRYKDYDSPAKLKFDKKYLIAAAGKPGHSSDWNTVKLAIRANSKGIFSLSNIDGVYDKDPKKFKDAKRLDSLSWQEYLNIIGNPTEHKPGAKYPVDPLAADLGINNNISFTIIKGDRLEDLIQAINGKPYLGTKIG